MDLTKKASKLFLISVLLFLGLSFLIGITVGYADVNVLYLLSAVLVSVPALLIPSLIFRKKNYLPKLKAPMFTHFLLAIVLGIGCILLNQALSCLTETIFYDVSIDSNSTTAETVMDMEPFVLVLSLAVIPPLSEEMFMRGTLLESWRRWSPIGAVIVTSIIFALLHTAPSSILIYFGIGMVMGLVYLITRNVWLSITVHFINNLYPVITVLRMRALGGSAGLIESGTEVSDAAAELTEQLTQSRAFYFTLFLLFAAAACAILIPLLFALRSSCRKHSIGMYEGTSEGIPEANAAPTINEPINEPRGSSPLRDNVFWIAVIMLLVLNVYSGLTEFGVIK